MTAKSSPIKVSVLVPTLHRHQILVETLEGVLRQNYSPMEILVYDQSPGHPPEVAKFLRSVSDRIRLERGPQEGLVKAYRRCVELSKGDVCLFLDDDVLIRDQGLVAGHARHYPHPDVGAVVGQILHQGQSRSRPPDARLASRYGWRHARFDLDRTVEDMPTVAAANLSFLRSCYEQVGGFDPRFSGNGFRFETDFSFALRDAGKRILFDPALSLVHRYGSPGGAENRHLTSISETSFAWHLDYFTNTWYFLLKWYSFPRAVRLMVPFWREQALNRALVRVAPRSVLSRHRALARGILRGLRSWNDWRRERNRP